MENDKKILIAMDASPHSLEAVQYAGGFFSPTNTQIELFHVDTHIPESFWDLNFGTELQRRMASVSSWAMVHTEAIKNQMDAARMILLELGFPYDSITLKYQDSVKGVTGDIIEESKNGFHAVVVGRTGVSRVKDFIMGNVATKLAYKILDMPVIIVGACTIPKKVIVAFDGSESAQRVVDSISWMIGKEANSIKICYVTRKIHELYGAASQEIEMAEEEMLSQNRKVIQPMIDEAVERLVDAGVKRENISWEIKENESSRSRALVKDAEANGFGTIAVGRRGLSRVEEFFIGRVSKKILQLAVNSTVWIVN